MPRVRQKQPAPASLCANRAAWSCRYWRSAESTGFCSTIPTVVSIVAVSEHSIYSIGALARMLGLPPATLRSWEDRYGVVVPERSAGSQRLYSRDHLDQLRFVCQQMQL